MTPRSNLWMGLGRLDAEGLLIRLGFVKRNGKLRASRCPLFGGLALPGTPHEQGPPAPSSRHPTPRGLHTVTSHHVTPTPCRHPPPCPDMTSPPQPSHRHPPPCPSHDAAPRGLRTSGQGGRGSGTRAPTWPASPRLASPGAVRAVGAAGRPPHHPRGQAPRLSDGRRGH